MSDSSHSTRPQRGTGSLRTMKRAATPFLLGLTVLAGAALVAQVGGDRGIAPVASSSDISIGGVEVDTSGDTAEEARAAGWQEAAKLAWERIDGPEISDSQLEGLVSAIVVERERIGPRRYIATLGVIFDRQRAGRFLGAGGQAERSAPMLLVPVTISGGVELVYEMRNPWQRAWAEYQTGGSRIDYVRPSGAGGDSLLISAGQVSRRSRTWWRVVLDQMGASDVLVPIAQLRYKYPGGPVEGTFTARYGPDSRFLETFTMTADSSAQLDAMLARAVVQFDRIFQRALARGTLAPDPTLNLDTPELDPALQRLIEMGRQAGEQERAAAAAEAQARRERANAAAAREAREEAPTITLPEIPAQTSSHTVQFSTPDAGAVDATLAAVRSAAGVRGVSTTSLALGGTSVMSVSFAGDLSALAAALRARGFTVSQGANSLLISR